jgi:hypothetical protein
MQRPFKPVRLFKKPVPKSVFFLVGYAVLVTVLLIFEKC